MAAVTKPSPMGRISEARVGDLLPILDRYRPVAIAATAVLVIVTVLPGAATRGGADAAAPASLRAPVAPPTTTIAPDAATGVVPPETPSSAPSSAPPHPGIVIAAAPSISPPPAASRAPFARPAPSGTGTGTASPPASSSPRPSPEPAEPDAPLRVARSGWATASAGTPLAAAGVPEGSLPVGTRLGRTDKASFVLLEGTSTELLLPEVAEGNRGPQQAVVQACRITEPGWTAGEGTSFDEAPEWDGEACTPGTRDEDGTWRFDLTAFDDRNDLRGFALVPGPDAPLDAQVAFRP